MSRLNIFYLILEKTNDFVEKGKLPISSGQDIAAEYEAKRSDAYQVIENLNIVKRILSVCTCAILIINIAAFSGFNLLTAFIILQQDWCK
jgi:hypothetical protein